MKGGEAVMKKLGYGLAVSSITTLFMLILVSGAIALPTTDVTVNYTDYPQVAGELKALTTTTVTNVYNGSGREHDNTVVDQTLAGPSQLKSSIVAGQTLFQTNGPHGKFTDNTEACGRCHALHTAKSSRLIRFTTMPVGGTANNTIYGTCTYCHNFNGQSTYDVKDGMIWDTADGKRYATSGGGFERMLVVEGEPAVATVVKTSSSHMVNKTNGTRFKAPGGYDGGDTSLHIELSCTACHNPHGSVNSRILREKILVGSAFGTPDLRSTSVAPIYIKVTKPFNDESVTYNTQITKFCATCHNDYYSSSAYSQSGDYDPTKYRHKIGMAPNEGINNGSTTGLGYNGTKFSLPTATWPNTTPGTVECITCHYVHGTFTRVARIPTADNIYVSSADNSIDLQNLPGYPNQEPPKNLRLDNRGVCQNCHNWSSVNQNPPVLADVLDPNQQGTTLYGDAGSLINATKIISNNSTTMVIRFNQYVLKTSGNGAESIGNYSLQNLTDVSSVNLTGATAKLQPDGRTVVIRLAAPLAAGKNYRLTVQNIKDTNFVAMNLTTADFSK